MAHRRHVRLIGLLAVALSLGFVSSGAGAAPVTPAASECRVAPRDLEAFLGLVATPAVFKTPDAALPQSGLPVGTVAPPEVVAGVTATMREALACANKGAPLQLYALFTDRYFATIILGVDPAELRAELTKPATPEPGDEGFLAAVWDVRLLPDGRAGALVARGDRFETQTRFLAFARVGDRWLIDEVWSQVELCVLGVDVSFPEPSGTPVPWNPECQNPPPG